MRTHLTPSSINKIAAVQFSIKLLPAPVGKSSKMFYPLIEEQHKAVMINF